jgi:hypothetical protein
MEQSGLARDPARAPLLDAARDTAQALAYLPLTDATCMTIGAYASAQLSPGRLHQLSGQPIRMRRRAEPFRHRHKGQMLYPHTYR